MKLRIGIVLATLLALAVAASPQAPEEEAPAQEQVLRFHSDITVQGDGALLVRETIQVRSLGEQIRHGIYRDFPTRYKDKYGNRYRVRFQFLGAQRDGQPEEYRLEDQSNGVRIYLGRREVELKPGEYTYTLEYRVERELGFFPDHDELYWNVNGTGWAFPVLEASATVHLPPGIPRDKITLAGYTGEQGSLQADLVTGWDEQGNPTFQSTRLLEPHQNLSIVVGWPKGYVAEPTQQQKFQWFLEDNRSALVGGAGLLVVFLYYFLAWLAVGRDPKPGTIMPLYEAPSGWSPAAVRYLRQMGYDTKAFAAAVVNMAVKKYLTIEKHGDTYTLRRVGNSDDKALAAEERAAAQALLGDDDHIKLEQSNHSTIASALSEFRKTLKNAEDNIYFFSHGRYMIPGILLTLATAGAAVATLEPGQAALAGFLAVWLTGWTIGCFALLFTAARLWKGVSAKPSLLPQAIVMSVFSLPFLGAEIFVLYEFTQMASPLILLAVLALIGLNVVFHYLLKAPTAAGRTVLDKIEGFRMFLSATEEDRLNRMSPVDKTPEVFEKFLPYALALNVEHAWAEQFAGVLGAAGKGPSSGGYTPAWYHGSDFSSLGAAGFASSLGGSFAGAIASSSTAPGSSSGGGGGGGSGGGGGGGGGGGW